jgi:hypothetical protein
VLGARGVEAEVRPERQRRNSVGFVCHSSSLDSFFLT